MNDEEAAARRKIYVPGDSVDVTVVVRDTASNMVLAIPHQNEVVVVFVSRKPIARVMSNTDAHEFTKNIRDAYQSIKDDPVLREMEKEFDD